MQLSMTFIEHNPTSIGSKDPFVRGHRYRVLAEGPSYVGHLTIGEVIEYVGAYYGHYDEVCVFAFKNGDGEERTWLLSDVQDVTCWATIFQPLDSINRTTA